MADQRDRQKITHFSLERNNIIYFCVNTSTSTRLFFFFSPNDRNRDHPMIFRVTDKFAHVRESNGGTDRPWKWRHHLNFTARMPARSELMYWQTGCETRKSHGSVLSIKHWYWYWYWWWRRRTDLSSMEMSPIHHMTRHGDCREMCGTIEDPFQQTVHPSYPHSIHEFAASKLSSVIWHVVVVLLLLLLLLVVVLLLCGCVVVMVDSMNDSEKKKKSFNIMHHTVLTQTTNCFQTNGQHHRPMMLCQVPTKEM